jgi:deoxyribonuclease-4
MKTMLFGTVGTPLSTPKNPGGSIGAIRRLSELNLGALELGWVQSVRVSEEKCAEIKAESFRENIALSVHAPYFINLNANDEEWPKSRKRLMDAAYYGNLAGATDIIFHPGSYFEHPPLEVLKIAIPRLQACVIELKEAMNPVTLRPETMGKSAMLGSLEDTLIMSREIAGVLPCLDFAHLHARPGDGSINNYADWTKIFQNYADALGTEAFEHLHIHLSGIEYTAKGEKNHLPIRESDFNIQDLFKALKDLNCGGRILCESPLLEEDALFLQELWLT